uniref:ABC transporter domain-containing protein n=1 Tax=Mucochytrium quahogii TaxID=96639 RepID=A0A7S2SQZ2_9STRA|mmetsp:Transcript_1310/g.2051  ORF Transcript_1310/g.2051 Transcript_1310/m.2051 type:complete len:632 (+) Transcript_1310:159-2054(+)
MLGEEMVAKTSVAEMAREGTDECMVEVGDATKKESAISFGANCEPCTISWKDLSCTVKIKKKGTKTILQPNCGVVKPGQLLAVMGPSGSGKTTLLDALANRMRSSKLGGKVLFNGRELKDKERSAIVSYVPQEDSLMGQFTVRETIRYAARFHYGLRGEDIEDRVTQTMEAMGLDNVADTLVGDIFRKGISGGQKRRLSIAVELISKPSILILDEPTSGLDSASAYGVIVHLRSLAAKGYTILLTIHQPSSEVWSLFDQFALLSRGHTMYFGEAPGAITYFSKLGYECPQYTNPADFMISIVNTDFVELGVKVDIEQLGGTFKASSEYKELFEEFAKSERMADRKSESENLIATKTKTKPGYFSQFLILSHRNMLNNLRNPGIYWVRLAMYVGLCLLIGVMFINLGDKFGASTINSRVSILFFTSAFLAFMSVAVLPFFIQERSVFLRERGNGTYSVFSYVLSNFVCMLPGLFLIALLSSVCVVFPAGLNGFANFLVCLFVVLLFAESLMNVVASVVPHYIIGIALGAGLFGFFMLCEGFFIVKQDIPDYLIWGYWIAPHSYAFRAFMYNEFHPIDSFDGNCGMQSGAQVLEFYGMQDTVLSREIGIVAAWAVFYQIIYGLILYVFHRGKR